MRRSRLNRAIHSDRLERWLGAEEVARISKAMQGWYGGPVPVANVPGNVHVHADGDFSGTLHGGRADSLLAYAQGRMAAAVRRIQSASRHWGLRQRCQMNAGFASLSDLIAEMTAGKGRIFRYNKTSTTEVINSAMSLWRLGAQPPAGAAGGASPGGTAHADSDTGAFTFTNPTGGDTQHLVRIDAVAVSAAKTLLLYDRLFSVAKTASSAAAESVTGVPTRYQGTAGAVDGPDGNFAFPEVDSAGNLGATAHNWDAMKYRDQAGNDTQAAASIAGRSGALANSVDLVLGRWYLPLLSGDTGVKDLDSMKTDATVTGALNWVIGHPLAWLPCPVAAIFSVLDGINSAFNLARVFDDACLALLSVYPPATTATAYDVQVNTVAG